MVTNNTLNKKKLKTDCFTVGFVLWWFYGVLASLDENLNIGRLTLQSFRYVGLVLIVGSVIFTERLYFKRIIVGLPIGLFIIINNAYLTKTPYFLELTIIIFCAIGIDFNRFIRSCFYSCLSLFLVIIILAKLDLIASTKQILNSRTRNFLGFNWPTFGPQYYLYIISLAIVYLKNRVTVYHIILFELVNVFLYYNTQTKSPFYLVTLFLIVWYIKSLSKDSWSTHVTIKVVFMLILPLASLFIYYMSKNYYSFLTVDQMLTGRLRLGYNALLQYPLTLFGRETILSAKVGVIGVTYQYVDSSLLQYMIKFGLISFIIFIAGFMLLQLRVLKNKNDYFMLTLALIFFDGIFDPQLIQMNNIYFVGLAMLFEPASQSVTLKEKGLG